MRNWIVIVIFTLFENMGCEHQFIFMKGVPASKNVGNLCNKYNISKQKQWRKTIFIHKKHDNSRCNSITNGP